MNGQPSHARSNRIRLCGVGGSDFVDTFPNPAAWPISSNSRAVYASPCGVEPSIWNENMTGKHGDARSAFTTNSTAQRARRRRGSASLAKEGNNSVTVELVEEVGQQHQIEPAAPVRVERTARQRLIALQHPRCLGVLSRD